MNLPNKNYIEDYCSVCKTPLPKGSIYCPECGPPDIHLENIERGLPVGKTAARILVLVALFAVAVLVKIEFKFDTLVPEEQPELVISEPGDVPDDQDYQLVHYINVSQANLRETPSGNGKIVGMVEQGQPLKILDKGEHWSKVQQGENTGWVATRLLTLKVE